MMRRIWAIAATAVALTAATAALAYRAGPDTEPAPIAVTARPVPLDPTDLARTTVGRLRYLGGVALTSPEARFGGLSGMRFLADGRLLAVGDEGTWITLTLAETGDRLTGVAAATLARLQAMDGRALRSKAEADAEALEIGAGGARTVAFERDHRLWDYDTADRPARHPFPDTMWLAALPQNSGLEAIARVGTTWLYLAEDAGPAAAFTAVLQGEGAIAERYGRLAFTPPPEFKPTDAAALDGAHVLILNRRYAPQIGVAAALTLATVDPARLTLSPPVEIARLEAPLTVDNMEALAVRRVGARTFVYMASDDNFSPLQRTLLLKFELLP